MSAPKPTRSRAFGFRVVSQNGEAWFFFESLQTLARGLALRLYRATRRIDHNKYAGPRTPYTVVDRNGTCLTWLRETPYQAQHSRFGAIWRKRVEWKTFEVFGKKGQPLQVGKVLQEFDLAGHLSGSNHWRVTRGERGRGPVWGVHKRRGGFAWLRRIKTSQEIRLNSQVLNEEREVPARAARSIRNLPTVGDDILRVPQRNWKKQSKARKQWAR